MEYQGLLEEVHDKVKGLKLGGHQADYIPELANIDSEQFGICLVTADGQVYGVGDYKTKFSIQSITKVYTLAMVYAQIGKDIWKRVGVEPSGNPFNSLIQLEHENGIPRNPFINAGALVITDALISNFKNPKEDILWFVEKISGEKDIKINHKVYESEASHSSRNRALANFMKSFGNINNSIDELIDAYCFHCAIEMDCKQLASSFLFFANHGFSPFTHEQILSKPHNKRLNALMLTCGCYDEAGEFAFKVGMPCKSGVGGGIVGIMPGKFSIAVWSPKLNKKGNSMRGLKALELLTTQLGHSLF